MFAVKAYFENAIRTAMVRSRITAQMAAVPTSKIFQGISATFRIQRESNCVQFSSRKFTEMFGKSQNVHENVQINIDTAHVVFSCMLNALEKY